ncbi:MAG: hypothetical protein NUW09_10055, partial [Deltaproteobacteria bacterium]|nr:hypothetical protein [Deltaproteobacteria bacterium]
TSWGLTGFLQKNDNGCLAADSADEFARSVLLLLDNENEYQRFRQKAEDYFLRHYSIDTWEKTLDNIFLV